MRKKSVVLRCFVGLALVYASLSTHAAAAEKIIDYKIDGQDYRGYAYFDDTIKTPRPLLVLIPNWLGTTAENREQAAMIAGSDYVVFVADMYGTKAQPTGPEAAGKLVGSLYANRPLLRERVLAAKTTALRSVKEAGLPADPTRIAAIGFCFGGATALELARTGDDIAAAVSFHGNLSLPAGKEAAAPIKARILALHGDVDPYVPAEQVDAFQNEMRSANVDWQLVRFGGAVHSFTDVHAKQPGKSQYDAKVASRAFQMMRNFLAEAFASR
ncbi:MAG: dienelactone hydrolase family protein [Pseudomonadota bacterium]|nr:dienelactone hydrolase family protein [Pseudomonadota bacterium]